MNPILIKEKIGTGLINPRGIKHTYFWHGEFSQWHMSDFEVNGITYNCAEQYMMAQKALLFEDTETLGKIMKADTPKKQKRLGKTVKGFDPDVWDAKCRSLVYDGNYAKFTQDESLKSLLRETVGSPMVEASPLDKIWGIGIGPDDPDRLNPNKWKGTNYLGEVLNAVRRDIFKIEADTFFKYDWEAARNDVTGSV